jgi:MerR family transcriptional regulator/heat shock protein HspR
VAIRNQQPNDNNGAPLDDEPCYVISIAARLVGLHQQTLRYYERAGLIEPKRTVGNIRMYSNSDIQRIRQVQRWVEEFGVNLAGAEIMMRMSHQIVLLQEELAATRRELDRLRSTRLPARVQAPPLRGLRTED